METQKEQRTSARRTNAVEARSQAVLPAQMREHARLEKEVLCVGMIDFVELWTKTQQLKAQAEASRERDAQWQRLTDLVDEAARALRAGGDTAAGEALDLLEKARWGN